MSVVLLYIKTDLSWLINFTSTWKVTPNFAAVSPIYFESFQGDSLPTNESNEVFEPNVHNEALPGDAKLGDHAQ